MIEVELKAGREKALLRGHPWVFSGSIKKVHGESENITPGETGRIINSKGDFIAWGAFSPASNIRLRVWTRNLAEQIDRNFFRFRLNEAIHLRRRILDSDLVTGYRLVHAESDGLPGIIIDKYADTLVMQCLSAGAEFWRDLVVELLVELTGCERVFERSDVEIRKLENLSTRSGPLVGGEPVEKIQIIELDKKYSVDIKAGQKTGFYLDQRENREKVSELAEDRSVLDCFAYTGGFSVSALAGGAKKVVAIESSSDSIVLGQENVLLNGLPEKQIEWIEGDVFQVLRKMRDQNRKFDMVILDPPKFAPTAAHAQRAARGYKDINLLGLKLLNPHGLLVTFSCSGGVSESLFQKILAGAALDAGVNAKIITRLGQGIDHPVDLSFPEGAYLKGFVLQV